MQSVEINGNKIEHINGRFIINGIDSGTGKPTLALIGQLMLSGAIIGFGICFIFFT